MAETLEDVAHRLTAQFYDHDRLPTRFAAYGAILEALRNERERCAKVAQMHLNDYRNNLSASSVAAAIREGK